MKTRTAIHMEFIDTTAIEDSTITSSGNVSFGNTELFDELTPQKDYGTVELNQFILDGSKEIPPVDVQDVAYWSEHQSDEECSFTEETWIQIDFTNPHTSAGIKLYFIDTHPTCVHITWYSLKGSKLKEEMFYPDGLEYFCSRQVTDYGKIVIRFVTTEWPERYVKLQYIKYGVELYWSENEIISASVLEEMDVTSATLSVNTADIKVSDTNYDFDTSKQDGLWKSIQKTQEVTITENVNGNDINCGTFFINTYDWKDCVASFALIDLIGHMDRTYFYGGRIYEKETAGVIINEIMSSAGITKYTVSDDVAQVVLSGYLGIQTHRSALQQVVFACGAVADCSRSDKVHIYIPDREIRFVIGTDRRFLGMNVTLDEYVSGVSISYSKYSKAYESTEIFNGTIPAGEYRIEFSGPYDPETLTVSAGMIVDAKTNYMIIHSDNETECVVNGYAYNEVENTYTANVDLVEAGETDNIRSYTGCTLVNSDRVKEVAEYILNYLQLRQIVTLDYLNRGECVGQWVNIMGSDRSASTTGITSQTLDLTGGNTASATCRGYSRVVSYYSYCGEFYAGEIGGDL